MSDNQTASVLEKNCQGQSTPQFSWEITVYRQSRTPMEFKIISNGDLLNVMEWLAFDPGLSDILGIHIKRLP